MNQGTNQEPNQGSLPASGYELPDRGDHTCQFKLTIQAALPMNATDCYCPSRQTNVSQPQGANAVTLYL
ncbi:MAG: hypothetical protein IGS50_07280 [Synechococcales cyanobacterium C42_A2020_086]|jgi:hypothetical protein|nr:hypothetical protein [Synechococcales cyanobacterium C42_A2020_086]